MSYSSLVKYVKISPNSSNPRNQKVDAIVIHHMAGNATVEVCGNIFAEPARQASSNYGVGTDGRIACYVEEENRAWTSGSREIDNRAITIEVANCGGEPDWKVSDAALESVIALCADICKRYGFKLNYTGDKSGNLHMHKWYQATACPGPYLSSKFPYIAEEVNKRLAGGYSVGDIVYFAGGKHYVSAWSSDGSACKAGKAKITAVAMNGIHQYHLIAEKDGGSNVYGWVDAGTISAEEKQTDEACKIELPVLSKGSNCASVKAMQLLLIGYGYDCGGYGADGDFGNGTSTSLVNYQHDNGLAANGICEQNTWAKLLGV